MPTLSDLFGIDPGALNYTPRRMRNLPPPPKPQCREMIEDLKRQFGL